jgi:hypothetical protein
LHLSSPFLRKHDFLLTIIIAYFIDIVNHFYLISALTNARFFAQEE